MRKKSAKQIAASRARFQELVKANFPANLEVVVQVDGPLRSDGTQPFTAWWMPGRWHNPDEPAAQCFASEPAAFKAMWARAGFTMRVLPGEYKLGKG